MQFDASKVKGEGRFDFPRIELKKDEVARINLFSTKMLECTVRHWVKKFGYVHCLALKKMESLSDMMRCEEEGGFPDDCYLCRLAAAGNESIGMPQRRFGARVLRYKTDMQGRILGNELQYWLEIWIFDNHKFRDLKRHMDEWGGLATHDLTLTCDNQQYQNMTIDVKKDALWKKDKEKVKGYLEKEVGKHDLMRCLGRVVDEETLRRRFAIQERRTAQEETPVGLEEEDVLGTSQKGEDEVMVSGKNIFDEDAVKKEVLDTKSIKEDESDFLDNILNDEKE